MRNNENFFTALKNFIECVNNDSKTVQDLLNLSRDSAFVPQIALSIGDLYFRKYHGLSKIIYFYVVSLCHELNSNDICIRLCRESIMKLLDGLVAKNSDPEEHELHSKQLQKLSDMVYSLTSEETLLKDNDIVAGRGEGITPLVIDNERLYFRNFYNYEMKIASFIKDYAKEGANLTEENINFYKSALPILFESEKDGSLNYQRIAAASALSSSFSVITGGPGTGKTTTVLNLLVLLLLQDQDLKVRLCAPTGKAAARMTESIMNGLVSKRFEDNFNALCQNGLASGSDFEKIKDLIPKEALTVHKLLGVIPHKEKPKFNEERLLPYDVLIIDEVSMISLGLFSKLIGALNKNTKVILLGDKDQLCSVEPGSVLSDLCSDLVSENGDSLSSERRALVSSLCSYKESDLSVKIITDYVAMLVKSRRFSDSSKLGRFAKAVNEALEKDDSVSDDGANEQVSIIKESLKDLDNVNSIFKDDTALEFFSIAKDSSYKDVKKISEDTASVLIKLYKKEGQFLSELGKNKGVVSAQDAKKYFSLLDRYRILCSNRDGTLGSIELNRILRKKLFNFVNNFVKDSDDEFFPGRVILINKNNDMLGVFNGDVGFIANFKDEKGGVSVKAIFPGQEKDKPRVISIEQLSDYEDGMAMTIHKSQGSEYENVIMVLPNHDNQVLCKELVYTGITRAKEYTDENGVIRGGSVAIIGNKELFLKIIKRRIYRESGLALRLKSKR